MKKAFGPFYAYKLVLLFGLFTMPNPTSTAAYIQESVLGFADVHSANSFSQKTTSAAAASHSGPAFYFFCPYSLSSFSVWHSALFLVIIFQRAFFGFINLMGFNHHRYTGPPAARSGGGMRQAAEADPGVCISAFRHSISCLCLSSAFLSRRLMVRISRPIRRLVAPEATVSNISATGILFRPPSFIHRPRPRPACGWSPSPQSRRL